jgi:cysteine desulfurase
LQPIRDRIQTALIELGAVSNGDGGARVLTAVNVSVPGWAGGELVAALDLEGVCAASGAACSSGLAQPSPVLRAMYPAEPWRSESALRLSFGPEVLEIDVEKVLDIVRRVLPRGGFAGS